MPIGKRLPQGVADLYTSDYEFKESLIESIKDLTKLYGFKPIQTPTFEYYELFSSMPGMIDQDQMIKLIDHDGKILVLRPDATIPIARMIANTDLQSDIEKLSYVTNVFRMQNGKSDVLSRSFTQIGVESFGQHDRYIDLEIIALAIDILKTSGVNRFQIDIGQAKFFQSLIEPLNLDSETIRTIQDKLEDKNEDELTRVLDQHKISRDIKEVLLNMIHLFGEPNQVIKQAQTLVMNEKMDEAIQDLKWMVQKLTSLTLDRYVSIDLGLVNHLNYYTGIMFKGYVHNFGKPVIQGGRYDQLTEHFGLKLDAIGFGVYLDQLMEVLVQQNIPYNQAQATISIHSKNRLKSFELAQTLRDAGWTVNLFKPSSVFAIDLDEKTIDIKGRKFPFDTTEDLLEKLGDFNE